MYFFFCFPSLIILISIKSIHQYIMSTKLFSVHPFILMRWLNEKEKQKHSNCKSQWLCHSQVRFLSVSKCVCSNECLRATTKTNRMFRISFVVVVAFSWDLIRWIVHSIMSLQLKLHWIHQNIWIWIHTLHIAFFFHLSHQSNGFYWKQMNKTLMAHI